jgi:general secretion pathway protein M
MRQHLQPYIDRYNQLAQREQRLLLVTAVVILVTLLFLLVWEPVFKARDSARAQLSDARALAQQLERAASQVVVARPAGAAAANRDRSLLAIVDQAARSGTLGKQPNRIQPDGDDAVRVWVEDIALERLLRWMAELESRHGLTVVSADIERRDPGQANARLQLGRAP